MRLENAEPDNAEPFGLTDEQEMIAPGQPLVAVLVIETDPQETDQLHRFFAFLLGHVAPFPGAVKTEA